MRTANEHLRRYPSARSSTLSWIERRNEKLAELRRDLRRNRFDRRLLRRIWKLLRRNFG